MRDVDQIRDEFPIVDHTVYLNHAAICPIPRRAHQSMVNVLGDYLHNALLNSADWDAEYYRVRTRAAALISARPDQIAFIKNTSEGIAIAANGIEWKPGDNVVVPAIDFPTVVYPWLNLKEQGVETQLIPAREGRILLDDIRAAIDGRTRAVVISTVQFSTGYRCDLAAIGELCRQHDLLFVVDGIQSLGALTLDVATCGVDVLAADAHKWLLGPQGIGILYVSDRALDRLKVRTVGWLSVNEPFQFTYELDLLPDARRFEPGSPNSVGIFGLGGALDLILEIGIQTIEQRILTLTDLLCDGLDRKGYQVLSPRAAGERSGIVIFGSENQDIPALFERLSQERIIVSVRGGGLRTSPHVYNTESEISQLLNVLPPAR